MYGSFADMYGSFADMYGSFADAVFRSSFVVYVMEDTEGSFADV